jgi:hypothetical protein
MEGIVEQSSNYTLVFARAGSTKLRYLFFYLIIGLEGLSY